MSRGRLGDAGPHVRALLPAAVTGVLAFRAGGFFALATAVTALVLLLGLLLHVTLARRPMAGWSVPMTVTGAALVLFLGWILVSATWSRAPSRVLPEFDRALAYTLLLVLAGTAATRTRDVAAALRWTGVAIAIVAVAGFLSRVAPGLVPAGAGIVRERLSFPTTYWNADGILFAIGLVLALHHSASGRERAAVRVAAAALAPVLAVALYLTISRGAIAAAGLGVVLYAALAHPRGLPTALLSIAPPLAVAVVRAYDADLLSRPDYTTAAARAQGHTVLLTVLAATAAAGALRALLVPLDARLERPRLSRTARTRILGGAGLVAVLVVVVAAIAVDAPARLDQFRRDFSHGGILPATGDVRDRLTQTGSNGRTAAWHVARLSFTAHPLDGIGSGAFRFAWLEKRPAPPFELLDAHSLYLETAAELGVPGLLLLLVALLTPVAVALRRLASRERHAHAAFLAAGLMLLAHAAVDWDWEMPALFAWFFGTAGIVLAARAGAAGRVRVPGRTARVLAGLGCLVVAVTPWLVAASQVPLDRAQAAFARGDCPSTVADALTAAGRLDLRPEPFELIGYCDVRLGRPDLAVAALQAAVRREPANWAYAYGLALVRASDALDPRAAALRARALDPLGPLPRRLARAVGRTHDPRRWRSIALRSRLPES